MNLQTYEMRISLFLGLLLMTFPGPLLSASKAQAKQELLLTDFSVNGPDLGWYVVNDNVMGGRSEGDFRQYEEGLLFSGRTNTDGGGFSSIRTRPVQLDLSTYAGIQLRLRGDGRRYTWRLTSSARWRGRPVSFWADFDTRGGEWHTINVPFASFIPRFRGFQLEGPALDTGQITGMGLMIYDNQDGPFELQLASVHAYVAEVPFALTNFQWKNRVLVLSAPSEEDKWLRAQQNEIALTADGFADRDMVLVTLLDNATSTSGERELTIEEAAEARTALGIPAGSFALRLIGKDGSVKLSRDKAVAMTEIYALIDSMPMRQRETENR